MTCSKVFRTQDYGGLFNLVPFPYVVIINRIACQNSSHFVSVTLSFFVNLLFILYLMGWFYSNVTRSKAKIYCIWRTLQKIIDLLNEKLSQNKQHKIFIHFRIWERKLLKLSKSLVIQHKYKDLVQSHK